MSSNIYLLLGITEEATWGELSTAYTKLMDSLSTADAIACESEIKQRVMAARQRLTKTFEEPSARRSHEEFQQAQRPQAELACCRPKLGQLLVASGLLTLEELDAALQIQRYTKTEHVPLGEMLVATAHLTEQQLDYYLRVQRLFELPPEHPERWGNRLVELGLVTEDQLKVALIEQRSTGCTLREALINRGWLTAEVLDRIF